MYLFGKVVCCHVVILAAFMSVVCVNSIDSMFCMRDCFMSKPDASYATTDHIININTQSSFPPVLHSKINDDNQRNSAE
jgi:hypothetical protein